MMISDAPKLSSLTETVISQEFTGTDRMWGIIQAQKNGQRVLRHGYEWTVADITENGDITTVTFTRDRFMSEMAVGAGRS